jgi:hypothetical protein
MSEKKLLEESTIRRFMKLANIKPLNETGMFAGGSPMEDQARFADGGRPAPGGLREEEEPAEEPEMDGELGGEEEEAPEAPEMGGMEGGDLKAKVDALVDAFNALLSDLPGMEGTEVGVEDDGGEEFGGEEFGGEGPEMEEASLYEELEEEGLTEELEEEGLTEELEEEGQVKEEGKKPEKKEKKKMDKEELAEELTRRVAARLMAEMKKNSKFVKKGTTGPKALTGTGTKSHGPVKGHGPKKVAPYNKHVSVKGLAGKGGKGK